MSFAGPSKAAHPCLRWAGQYGLPQNRSIWVCGVSSQAVFEGARTQSRTSQVLSLSADGAEWTGRNRAAESAGVAVGSRFPARRAAENLKPGARRLVLGESRRCHWGFDLRGHPRNTIWNAPDKCKHPLPLFPLRTEFGRNIIRRRAGGRSPRCYDRPPAAARPAAARVA